MNIIEVRNLKRIYRATAGVIRRTTKEIVAVDDISFDIKEGELFGLLGPNGAGKTTSVKVLATLLIPDAGEVRVKGKIGRGVKSRAFKKEEADAMIANITWTTDYSQLAGADLVIEAATEDVGIKKKIFAEVEKICSETTIFASNSSHMEPEVIFSGTERPALPC